MVVYGFRYVFVMVSFTFFMVSVAGFLVDSAAAGGSNIFEGIERLAVFGVFRTGFRRWFLYGFRRGRKTCFMVSVVGFVEWFPSWQGTFFMVSVVGFVMVSGCYRTAAFSPMETVKKHQDVSVTS